MPTYVLTTIPCIYLYHIVMYERSIYAVNDYMMDMHGNFLLLRPSRPMLIVVRLTTISMGRKSRLPWSTSFCSGCCENGSGRMDVEMLPIQVCFIVFDSTALPGTVTVALGLHLRAGHTCPL
jgi:hypothetical protein